MNQRQLRALAKRMGTGRLPPLAPRYTRMPWDDGRFDKDRGMHAILIGHQVKTCNLMTWARWNEATARSGIGRHVADETAGRVRVSTVFLGIDHNHGWGAPRWFETMVFVAGEGVDLVRYSTWEEAEAGHAAMVKKHTISAWPSILSPSPGAGPGR